ncbi:MAG: tyrosine-type recombinase/integrase, partial [Planctomycetes bacterium]|nr:tyrosine-type recombinase/integrase [Planctomycetota bacterium]
MTSGDRRSNARRAPHRFAVLGEWLTLNRSTGQAYFNVHDAERGCRVRRYMGRLYESHDADGEPVGEPIPETLEKAQRYLIERGLKGGTSPHPQRDESPTVRQVCDAFLAERREFAGASELGHFRKAFDALCALYGSSPARDFGPLALHAVRESLIAAGRLNRKTLNNRVDRIKMMFKWAVSREMVPPSVSHGLQCIEGIRKNRKVKGLREPRKVSAVDDARVDAVLPLVSPQVAAIIQLMRFTGARCGEIVQARPCDVDRSRTPWVYTPRTHKTAHHDHDRPIRLGPQARKVLAPWLLRAADAPCFSPREAEEARRAANHAERKTPLRNGNRPGYSARRREQREPEREPGEEFTTDTVRRAIQRACKKAGVKSWSPHQLRHA